MPWQLVYTSSPRTLTPGQSGFGTVARTVDLRDALIQRLEQLSTYSPGATLPGTRSRPAVHAYRLLHVRGTNYHLLSRIVEAPLDFTRRTNHLAHHLVLDPSEIAPLPSPATILRLWDGWRDAWTEEPRFLDDGDWGNLHNLPRRVNLPAAAWNQWTGDAGRAASLLERPTSGFWSLLVRPDLFPNLLQLFAESLQLLDPDHRHPERCWDIPFTTCAQSNDAPGDFRWRAWPAPQAAAPGTQGIDPTAISLDALPIPSSNQAILARTGPQKAAVPSLRPDARPSTSKPDSAGARLRLSGKGHDLPEHRDSSSQAGPSISRPAARRPNVTARMWTVGATVLGLTLLLVGGFLWPGWFVTQPHPTGTPRSPHIIPAPIPGDSKAVTPGAGATTSSTSTVESARAQSAATSRDSQNLLDAVFDRIPTYLLPTRSDENPVRVSGIPELDALLARVFGRPADLAQGPVNIVIEQERIPSFVLSTQQPDPKTRATFEHFGGKRVTIPEPESSSPLVVIDASSWSTATAYDGVTVLLSADRFLRLVFHPAPEGPPFTPFRLLALGGKPPEPVTLPKSFLRPGTTNVVDALDPELVSRLPRSMAPPSSPSGFHLELNPFTGNPPSPLYEPYQAEFPIPPGSELAWDWHRPRLVARIAESGREVEKLQKETEQLATQVEAANAQDLPVGNLLGIDRKPASKQRHLLSLAAFTRNRGSEDYPTRTDFLEYLRTLFHTLKVPCDDLLDSSRRKPGEHELGLLYARLDKSPLTKLEGFARIHPEYFTNRWAQLGSVDLLRAFRDRLAAASQRTARLQELLDRLPRSLEAVPRVNLNIVDARGHRIEWIRFADPPTAANP